MFPKITHLWKLSLTTSNHLYCFKSSTFPLSLSSRFKSRLYPNVGHHSIRPLSSSSSSFNNGDSRFGSGDGYGQNPSYDHVRSGNLDRLKSISYQIVQRANVRDLNQKQLDIIQQLCTIYYHSDPLERFRFLCFLSDELSAKLEAVTQASSSFLQTQSRHEPFDPALLVDRLQKQIRSPYLDLFRSISKLGFGVKFLVDLRSDLLTVLSHTQLTAELAPSSKTSLRLLSTHLADLLSLWFTAGFIRLERVTWDSPTSILQKITEYEAVHPIKNWLDLKHRLGLYRRCYMFSHLCLQGEPLVILHVALAPTISSSIQEIIDFQREKLPFQSETTTTAKSSSRPKSSPIEGYCPPSITTVINGKTIKLQSLSPPPKLVPQTEDPDHVNAAVFYSISSTQKGLNGIDLGNKLIKQVAANLKAEFPLMSRFSTLSPIPYFNEYLLTSIQSIQNQDDSKGFKNIWLRYCDIEMLSRILGVNNEIEFYNRIIQLLRTGDWITDQTLKESFKEPLMRICAHYLYKEKRRGYALNPVANFHLKNGAVLWRLNWLADISTRGLSNSCGIMVNYRYYLETYDQNSQIYLNEKRIITGEQFIKWLP